MAMHRYSAHASYVCRYPPVHNWPVYGTETASRLQVYMRSRPLPRPTAQVHIQSHPRNIVLLWQGVMWLPQVSAFSCHCIAACVRLIGVFFSGEPKRRDEQNRSSPPLPEPIRQMDDSSSYGPHASYVCWYSPVRGWMVSGG